jgi:hypothetical protein
MVTMQLDADSDAVIDNYAACSRGIAEDQEIHKAESRLTRQLVVVVFVEGCDYGEPGD